MTPTTKITNEDEGMKMILTNSFKTEQTHNILSRVLDQSRRKERTNQGKDKHQTSKTIEHLKKEDTC